MVAEPNRRLELRFRPDDAYCKPACGEKHHGSSFLLRVRKMRKKAGRRAGAEGKPEVTNAIKECPVHQDNTFSDSKV